MPDGCFGKRGRLLVISRRIDNEPICIGHADDLTEEAAFLKGVEEIHRVTIGDRLHHCKVESTKVDDLAQELGMPDSADAGEVLEAYLTQQKSRASAKARELAKSAA